MKKVFLFLLLSAVPFLSKTADAKEMVYQEDFDKEPAGWTVTENFKWDAAGGKDGKGAYTAVRTSGKEKLLASKKIKLEYGVRYQITLDFNSKLNADKNRKYQIPLGVRFFKNGKAADNQNLVRSDPGDGKKWRSSSFQFVIPANYDQEIAVELGIYSTRTGQIWYDNLRIEAVERFGAQFTHVPFLSHTTIGQTTVNFFSDRPTPGAVDYREKGSEKWTRVYDLIGGQMRNTEKEHFITLKNLKPGAVYEYRAVLLPVPHLDSAIFSNVYEFTAAPDKMVPFSVFFTSDTQVGVPNRTKLMQSFVKNAKADQCDIFVHGGDIANGYETSGPEILLDSYVNAVCGKNTRSQHFVTVRGNHEYRGSASGDFFKYLSGGTNKSYFAFRYGAVCFIVLDSGETVARIAKSPDYCRNFTDSMMLEQREFLAQLVKTPLFKDAKYRVVLAHAPIFGGDYYAHMTKNTKTIIDGILLGDNAEKIHLWLCGHTHSYARPVKTGSMEQMKFAQSSWGDFAQSLPFVTCVNDGPGKNGGPEFSGIRLDFSDNGITVTAVCPEGKEFDKFLIKPDGQIGEISTKLVKKSGK